MRYLAMAYCIVFVVATAPHAAQPETWTRPFPPFRVIGNLYAVGTYDLSVFLITSSDGHILINTGLKDSVSLIQDNRTEVSSPPEYARTIFMRIKTARESSTKPGSMKEKTASGQIRLTRLAKRDTGCREVYHVKKYTTPVVPGHRYPAGRADFRSRSQE